MKLYDIEVVTLNKNDDNVKKIESIIKELNRYSYEYYVLDNPTISDGEYDKKYDKLVELEKETGIVLPDSPTQRVGDVVLQKFDKYVHKNRLWSMDKAQSVQAIREWHERNQKFVNEYNLTHEDKLPKLKYILTKKFDGLTINCTYDENGALVKAATRGTGEIGEDVTEQVKTITSIPLKIKNNSVIEVHGEAIMTKRAFEDYNKNSDVSLKNLRNGAAGALRNLNVRETARRKLSAFFYDVGYNEGNPFATYGEMMDFIKRMGFPQDSYIKECSTILEIEEELSNINNIRNDLQYDIDGVVIVIDDMKTREMLGYTVKFPRWSIAYKFEAEETTTELSDVEWNVGRSGRVTPTAILEPVELAGATIKRATLNNIDDIRRKGIKKGCRVFVRRSNDVIPEITGVVEESSSDGIEIEVPEFCPYCGSELVQDGVHYFCENTMSCKPQLVKSIVHFGSREAMNIEGFSEKTAMQLFEKMNIKSIPDLFRISRDKLMELDKFGEKKSQNLLDSIEKSKKCDLASFIYALGIPNVGKKTAVDLASKFKSLDAVRNASYDELVNIQDIGDTVSNSIVEFFKQDNIINSIEELIRLGVKPYFNESRVIESEFSGKTVVVTGKLKKYTRSSIKQKLRELGANVSESVSGKTDCVIAGESAGSKYDKALKLGITILSEDQFENMV